MSKKSASKPRGYPAPSSALSSRAVMEVKAGVFKDTCLQLLDDVRDRDLQIIVTKYGEPVAKLVAAEVEMPSAFGFMSGTIIAEDDIVAPDFDSWGDLA
ncbi:MAG TPA: type II toxin-antitoxin system prevent-host-death family antitoxin [Gemmatimonadaceae bacterium]|nr:type II toxin-antitoxin system prevent-host-death family antitoxin [Gemmatimonadaceae bacterium]